MVQLVPMGLKDLFVAAPKTPSESVDVSAALSPFTVSAYPLTSAQIAAIFEQ